MDMKNSIRKVIVDKINSTVGDIVNVLEENRQEPAGRGCGTAPSDSSVDVACDCITALVEELGENYSIYKGDLTKDLSIDKIIQELQSTCYSSTADEFDCLTQVDSFIRDNGELKYRYVNTIYQYNNEDCFICVEEQQSVNGKDFEICSTNVNKVEKKEITTYEWS